VTLAVIAPEPARWVAEALASHEGPAWLFAPWDLSSLAPFASALPATIRARIARFSAPRSALVHARSIALWHPAIAASRLWERGRADRQLAARFAFRAAADALAGELLPRDVTAVIAASGAARRVFAKATAVAPRASRTWIQDTPVLDALHEDLDRAAIEHPERAFLRRYRAPYRVVARQRAEWTLATSVVAKGPYAARSLAEHGCDAPISIAPAPASMNRASVRAISRQGPLTLLLAGFAAARNGSDEALALLDAMPECTLLVRRGEGSEPRALFEHPRVKESSARERESLDGVDLVLAPAVCESYSPEVQQAIERGVRVIATERGLGTTDATAARDRVSVIEPLDARALIERVRAARGA